MPMERFHRGSPRSERARSGSATAPGGKVISKKTPKLGRVAESFHRWNASFGVVRKRDHTAVVGLPPKSSSPFLDALFHLPNELHLHILRELSVADILSLRQTSRVLNDLITGNAPALVRHWVRCRLGDLHLRLYTPRHNAADFPFLLAMRRRHIASIRLTRHLADILVGDPLEQSCPRQRQLWTSVYERMMPLVFGVGYFLDEHRRVLLERDLGRIRPRSHIGYNVCTTNGITEQERMIMNKLDPPLRLQYFYMYCFIVQVLMRKLRPTSRTGPVEKFLRGWLSQPACPEDVAFFLILGGIGQIAKLLSRPTYSERRRYLHAFRTHMSPHTSRCWRRHWRDIGVVSPALLDDIPCTKIGITQLDQIWRPLIAQMMAPGSRDFTEQEKICYEELAISNKFINQIMGYDILQGRPADGGDSDDEQDCERI